jgi:hypothetical protein
MVSPAAVVCTAPDRGFCTDPRRINDVRRVRVVIDGAPLTIRNFDWVSRQAFEIGGDAGAVGGYMYIITGLTPGTHTIETLARIDTGARTRDFRLTATVTVG